jgi:hypothetical protein
MVVFSGKQYIREKEENQCPNDTGTGLFSSLIRPEKHDKMRLTRRTETMDKESRDKNE